MASRRDRDDDFDDDRPSRRRDRDDVDDYADDQSGRGAARGAVAKGMNVCGLIALIMGIIGLLFAAFPCTFFIGLPIAGIGLILGVIGLMTSGKTSGRGMPIAGTCVSLAGVIIGGVWLGATVLWVKKAGEEIQVAAQTAQDNARVQSELAEERRKKDEKELREGKAVTVTAQQLDKDYDENPINADRKYKDKVLEITGKVGRVNRDKLGRSWIEFETDETTALIKCEFARDSQDQLAKVESKKTIVVRGKCKGKTMGRGKKDDEIVLENCILVTKTAQ